MIDKRVVIITGGAGGIGGVLTKKFSDEGDVVVMVDIDEAAGKEREAAFQKEGKEVVFLKTDISNEEECVKLIQTVMDKYGRIDVLHNNAGILGKTNNFLKMETSEFRKVMEINLVAAMTLTRLVATEMIKTGIKGVILNTSSLAGKLPNHEPICYPVSKAGISMLTQATARELGPYGIRVVAVAPGWVRNIVKGGTIANPFERPDVKELHMNNRVVEKEEVANVAYFMSTEAASAVTGTTVMVDNGYTGFKIQTSLYEE